MNNTCGVSGSQNNLVGVMLIDASENYLHGNTFVSNQVAIALTRYEFDGALDNTIVGNVCIDGLGGAILVSESSGNYLDTNSCTGNNGPGITLYMSNDNRVVWNESSNNQVGISVTGVNNIIEENNCIGNVYGLNIGPGSQSNAVVFNRCENNSVVGILTYGTQNNRIYLNTFGMNGRNALSANSANQWTSTEPVVYYQAFSFR